MANINRDYLIVLDVKSSVISEADELKYYITDEHSQNLFVNLVVRDIERINKYVEVHDPEKYELELHIVKPNNDIVRPHLQASLLSVEDALYAFELPKEAVDYIGTYKCELRVTYKETEETTVTTSNKFKYKVKRSIYNDLDEITEAPEYPLVIQLFDKLSDINQYEEDRRANELARQLAEQQRQTRFDALGADMVDNMQEMDDKVVEVENRITTKEQAVDKLIVDTKADIDNYKEAKDQEIDDYKTAKDTEINNVITAQDNKIDTAISEQNDRISNAIANQDTKIDTAITAQNDKIEAVQNNDAVQNNKLDTLQNKATIHEERITATEVKNIEQDSRLDMAENRLNNIGNDITNTMQPIIDAHTSRLSAIEAIDVAQNSRLDAIEAKNQQQDDRLLDIEKVNKRQDMNLKCLFAESKNSMIDIEEEGNSIYLQNSTIGYTLIDEIKGNTLVNYNKEPDKELILNGNINTSGDNTVTITEGVDGGLVDVALEGNTLVNVSKTKDSTAITKAYTVENSGNHIALQGDVDGSCKPVITGKTLVNLAPKIVKTQGVKDITLPYTLKSNTTYTFILDVELVDDAPKIIIGILDNTYSNWSGGAPIEHSTNFIVYTITTDNKPSNKVRLMSNGGVDIVINSFILIEGDYTDKPIPDYFEGLQSTFEDNLVTQEMIDSGEEVSDNLGKYKLEYKVTGKNKFDGELEYGGRNSNTGGLIVSKEIVRNVNNIVVKPNTSYCMTVTNTIGSFWIYEYDCNYNYLLRKSLDFSKNNNKTFKTSSNTKYIGFNSGRINTYDINEVIQIEEGDTPTEYEPYKAYIKTLYLNSALLGADTIEEKDNGIYHVHRSELLAYTEGDETSLITDKVNTLHQLEIPQYELIEQSNLAIPSYANGHLDLDSAVPVERVEFKPFREELTYLYANTQYTVQFVSDKAITANIALGGTQLSAQSIVAGLNRITITTPEGLVDNKLIIDGVGAKISEVVVTDTDREFGYFEGMKSVGEGEELEIISANSDNTLSNTQQLTHEPLRGVGEIKDRYVLIDGKWYICKKCGIRAYQEGDEDIYKTDLVNTVYPLEMPTYEEIDYNPFEVYSGVTHISTNSTIPTNITVKNTGFNCLLKPSTTYTISSNLGLNTVTTPSTLTEDCLRFMDTDTSDKTTMKDVLILEGDWTTKPDLIPSNFSGIESAFEQEYDAEKGKYKVNAKIANEDKSKENNITFYIDEPLRGVGNVKDRVYVKDDKVVVQRKCGIRPYEDGDFGTHLTDKVNTVYPLTEPTYEKVEYNDTKLFIESFKNSTLFYNSNVPVSSKLYYSYSVPLVDTVAQTASISDEQDLLLVNMATEIAIMQLTL